MKKLIAVMLLCLTPALFFTAAAYAADAAPPVHMMVTEGKSGLLGQGRLFVADGTLYIKIGEEFYLWRPGDAAPKRTGNELWAGGVAAEDAHVFSQCESVFAVDTRRGLLYRLKHTDGAFSVEQSWTFPVESAGKAPLPSDYSVCDAAFAGNSLCLLISTPDTQQMELWWFSPGDTALARVAAPAVRSIAAYDDTGVLAVYETDDGKAALACMMPAAEDVDHIASLNRPMPFALRCCLQYIKSSELVLFAGKSTVYAYSLRGERTNAWPMPDTPHAMAVLNGTRLATLSDIGLNVLDISAPAPQKTHINIAGAMP